MLDEKKLKRVDGKISGYVRDEIIKKSDTRFVDFFKNNALESLDCATLLFEESKKNRIKGYLWVINCSYYSMFYTVRALLEKSKIKVDTIRGIHAIVFDCFVHYFYNTGKVKKALIEDFADAETESAELLCRAKELVQDYYLEKGKREDFTYEMGMVAMEQKAKTSLERAKRFNEVLRRLV